MRSLNINEFFKITQNLDEKEANVTGKTEVVKYKNKNTTYDADTNAEDNKIFHNDKGKLVQQKKRGILWNIRKQ